MSASSSITTSERGRETRRRILDAALAVFGAEGYEQATTRRIADRAQVALPAIRYYFDHKEGLYLACAREIVSRYQAGVGDFLGGVVADLADGCSPEVARTHLKAVMRRVSAIAEAKGAGAGTAFVMREMSEQGPAFEVLYRELWQPGMHLTAELVARIRGLAAPDRDAHLRALMLHASLTAFTVTRPVSDRFLDESGAMGSDRHVAALAVIETQIDQIGGAED